MKYIFLLPVFCMIILGTAKSETFITSDISIPTQWTTAGSPYKIMKEIAVSSELKIQKGVEILLDKGVSIEVTGRIEAIGTADSLVVFSALSDHAAQHWGKIIMLQSPMTSPSILEFCLFQNGGFTGTTPLELRSSRVPVMKNISMLNNKRNAIEVHIEVVKYGVRLSDCNAPYTFADNCYIEQGYDVIIDPGVILKLPGSWFLRVRGNIIAIGTPEKPIIFTSIYDDLIDGIDTENLGHTTGTAGDWGGIILEGSVNHGKTAFRNCKFKYGGGSQIAKQAFLFFFNSMARIDYCSFEHTAAHAIYAFSDAMPDLGGGHLNSLGHNKFIGFYSPKYAISNLSQFDIPAKYNCWGTTDTAKIKFMNQALPGKVITNPILTNCDAEVADKAILIEPLNNSANLEDNVTLKWFSVPFVDFYKVQISKAPDFAILEKEFLNLKDTSVLFSDLNPNSLYYWRVASNNFIGQSEWSDIWAFRTKDVNPPTKPILNFPNNDYKFTFCQINLKWHPVQSAIIVYEIQISEKSDFSILEYSESNLTDTTLSLPALTADTKYFWRVRAKNNIAWGDWSEVWSFNSRTAYSLEPFNITTGKVTKAFSADVNGDGMFDIILENESGVFFHRNLGNNSFQSYQVSNIKTIEQLEFADFNKDNKIDFAILGKSFQNMLLFKIFRFDGAAVVSHFEIPLIESAKTASFAVGEIYGSGNKDIALKYYNNDTLSVYKNINGTFSHSVYLNKLYWGGAVVIKDIDNNGTQNIIYQANIPGTHGFDTTLYYSYELNHDNTYDRKLIGGNYKAGVGFYHLKNSHFYDPNGNGFYDMMNFSFAESFLIGVANAEGISVMDTNSTIAPNPAARYENMLSKPLFGQFIDIDNDGGNDFFVQDDNNFKIFDTQNHRIADKKVAIDSFPGFKFQCLYSEYDLIHLLGIRNDSLFVIRNNNCATTLPPIQATAMKHILSGKDVILEWEISKDKYLEGKNNTKGGELNGTRSFSIKLGTYPGGNDVLMPESDPNTGKLFTLREGNAGFKWQYLLKNLPVGKYYWSIQTIDGGYRYSDFSDDQSFEISSSNPNFPENFSISKSIYGDFNRITIKDDQPLTYKGSELPDSSVIAVFHREDSLLVLHGYHIVKKGKPLRLTVWNNSKSDEIIDDYRNYVYFLWEKGSIKVVSIKPEYPSEITDNYFNIQHINLTGFVEADIQTIQVKEKKWQIVSSSLNPYLSPFDFILSGKNLSLFDENNRVYETSGEKDINNWNNYSAYRVYSVRKDSLEIIGSDFLPSSLKYTLNKGWHLLPYPYGAEMRLDSVYKYLQNVKAIVNSAGELYFPEKNVNTIGNVMPGEGLSVFIDKDSTEFSFSDGVSFNSVTKPNLTAKQITPISSETGKEMFLIFDSEQVRPNDEIAAVSSDGTVFGSAKFLGNTAVLTIWGDNVMTESVIDGASQDEKLSFYYYSTQKRKTYLLNIDTAVVLLGDGLSSLSPIVFKPDYVCYRILDLSDITSISETENSGELNIFPNPAKDFIMVDYPSNGVEIEYSILNSLGETVLKGNFINRIDVSSLSSGLYMLKAGTQFVKFIKI